MGKEIMIGEKGEDYEVWVLKGKIMNFELGKSCEMYMGKEKREIGSFERNY